MTVLLQGDLGAGKTTFTQGLARGLGYEGHVVSPTYALEQRYETPTGPLLHLDLYRLNATDASRLLRESDDHAGVRCVEWPERTATPHTHDRMIEVAIAEIPAGRRIDITFTDTAVPTRTQIETWRREMMMPHIAAHCDAVADLCDALARRMMEDGIPVRPLLLRRAAEIHDLLRFIDFRPGAAPAGMQDDPAAMNVWKGLREKYRGLKHEAAGAAFLREQGFDALAAIVEVHGLLIPSPQRKMIEQQLLFYADKRVQESTVVSLEERFDDFARRYCGGEPSEEQTAWLEEVKALEEELFGTKIP